MKRISPGRIFANTTAASSSGRGHGVERELRIVGARAVPLLRREHARALVVDEHVPALLQLVHAVDARLELQACDGDGSFFFNGRNP
jgi:hypothetical protein